MNFLRKLISHKILKSIEKLATTDPVLRKKFDELGKDADDLAKLIAASRERKKHSSLYKK